MHDIPEQHSPESAACRPCRARRSACSHQWTGRTRPRARSRYMRLSSTAMGRCTPRRRGRTPPAARTRARRPPRPRTGCCSSRRCWSTPLPPRGSRRAADHTTSRRPQARPRRRRCNTRCRPPSNPRPAGGSRRPACRCRRRTGSSSSRRYPCTLRRSDRIPRPDRTGRRCSGANEWLPATVSAEREPGRLLAAVIRSRDVLLRRTHRDKLSHIVTLPRGCSCWQPRDRAGAPGAA